jgi:hypothetical protein
MSRDVVTQTSLIQEEQRRMSEKVNSLVYAMLCCKAGYHCKIWNPVSKRHHGLKGSRAIDSVRCMYATPIDALRHLSLAP